MPFAIPVAANSLDSIYKDLTVYQAHYYLQLYEVKTGNTHRNTLNEGKVIKE